MAVRRLQYSQELEKQLAAGKGLEEAHAAAAKKSTVKRVVKRVVKKKVSWVEKLKMGVTKQLARKRHSPAGRKYLERKK